MPLDQPQSTTGGITWVVNGRYNSVSATAFQLIVTTEGGTGYEAEGDAFLQALVDALAPHFYAVNGIKGYTDYTSRNMLPS